MIKATLTRGGDDGKSFYIESNIEKMLLDTGAAVSQVTTNKNTENLEIVSEIDASGLMGSKKVKVAVLPMLAAGGHQAANLHVTVNDSQAILGMDFLKTTGMRLALADDSVEFGHRIEDGDDLVLDERMHPYIQCTFHGEQVWGLVDTGASVTIIDESFYLGHTDCFQKSGTEQGTDWTGAQQETPMVQIIGLTVGAETFEGHAGAVVDLTGLKRQGPQPVVMIIGATSLELAVWDFDFQNRKWRVEKTPAIMG